jgi:hypothetical protein
MFTYDLNATDAGLPRHRCYRPDLQQLIARWLSYVPESEWQYFVGFRVGQRGEFIAKFMKAPTHGGALRLVTCTVDHNYSEMRTDTGVWYDSQPVRLTSENLAMAVDSH